MSDLAVSPSAAPPRRIHPIVWLILYIPFGALGGFVALGLTFLATQHGLSITEGALLNGSNMVIQWLKWLWAPVVDVTLSPKRWYAIATGLSAAGVLAMSAVPLGKQWLWLLLIVIAASSFVNSVVGMAAEAMIAKLTPPEEIGRASSWFQAGNLGGNGLGGALSLVLLKHLPSPWMAGAVMGALFMSCCAVLKYLPEVHAFGVSHTSPLAAVRDVARGLWDMVKTRAGFLSALLCVLPVGTGAAGGTLVQAEVAKNWGAGEAEVILVQGLLAGLITAFGAFNGGWLLARLNARASYAVFGLMLVAIAVGMALWPPTVMAYVVWNMVYAFGVGLAYAAFTAVALTAVKDAPAATGYNVFASLSNFPIWWLGLLLGWMADPTKGARHGPSSMLLTEAALGVVGIVVFAGVTLAAGQSLLGGPEAQAQPDPYPSA